MAVRELNPGNTGALLGEAVSQLIEDFVLTEYGKVVEVVALATGAEDEAEDAVQVALLRILARGWRPAHLGLHVTVMASKLIYSRRRRALGVVGWIREVFALHRADRESNVGALRRSVPELPRGQRLVALLHYYLGYPLTEISLVMGVPEMVVKGRLNRARSKLKVLLGEDETR